MSRRSDAKPSGSRMERTHQNEPISHIVENAFWIHPPMARPIPNASGRLDVVKSECSRVSLNLPPRFLKPHRKIRRTAHHESFVESTYFFESGASNNEGIRQRVRR